MRHPVFRIDQKRLAEKAENALDGFNHLHTEYGCRRHQQYGRLAQQRLLQIRQRFPVYEAGRPIGRHRETEGQRRVRLPDEEQDAPLVPGALKAFREKLAQKIAEA